MTPATPLTAYFVWAVLVVGGALLALADWRWIRRPLLGSFLIFGLLGGFLLTKLSPFDFVTGGYYMQGLLIFGGSGLALIGYVLTRVCHFAGQRIRGGQPKP